MMAPKSKYTTKERRGKNIKIAFFGVDRAINKNFAFVVVDFGAIKR